MGPARSRDSPGPHNESDTNSMYLVLLRRFSVPVVASCLCSQGADNILDEAVLETCFFKKNAFEAIVCLIVTDAWLEFGSI